MSTMHGRTCACSTYRGQKTAPELKLESQAIVSSCVLGIELGSLQDQPWPLTLTSPGHVFLSFSVSQNSFLVWVQLSVIRASQF